MKLELRLSESSHRPTLMRIARERARSFNVTLAPGPDVRGDTLAMRLEGEPESVEAAADDLVAWWFHARRARS